MTEVILQPDLINFLNNKKVDFLMRVSDFYWQQEIGKVEKDEEISVIISANRRKELKKHNPDIKTGDSISFRVIKFKLDSR
ncbi:MAG: hypothetical protein MZU91_05605 [Desulfosudis oleivorans]|nr:hypothetical protein [Desulfosudis oleivorans]